MSVKTFVDQVINSHKIAVFSKSFCPFCSKAKSAIGSFSLKPGALEWIEIDQREDCEQIQDYLKELTGARSVPRVFIGGKFLGGGDDTVAAKSNGTLEKKLKDVGAI
ncbi:Glutaredoxin-1 protein [Aphelenchoides besseyi]|nr:Glutaredoxin-1 protein [Aphelenchoides besseyi]KAI6216694.1 Glutaredoxin-1 protein [Aphelenchoides besseyi]